MRVGLVNIEPKVFNTAYMQIAAYHKGRGDTVEWWLPLIHRHFDVVYCSSLFDFTDKSGIPDDVICGGTGFDVTSRHISRLPDKLSVVQPGMYQGLSLVHSAGQGGRDKGGRA